MNNRRRLAAAAATALAATAGAVTLGATAGDTQVAAAGDAPRTLTLSVPWDDHGRTRYIDLGKKGEGPGDVYLTSGVPITNERTGRKVGELDAWETILSMAHNGTVIQYGSLRLRDGRLDGAGITRHTDPVQPSAVTAGTGAYANARGVVTVREDPKRKVNIIQIKLFR